jgi:hypothetical protein
MHLTCVRDILGSNPVVITFILTFLCMIIPRDRYQRNILKLKEMSSSVISILSGLFFAK